MYRGRDVSGRYRPRSERRDRDLHVRVTDRDLSGLDDWAAALSVTRSEVVVMILRGELRCVRNTKGGVTWRHDRIETAIVDGEGRAWRS